MAPGFIDEQDGGEDRAIEKDDDAQEDAAPGVQPSGDTALNHKSKFPTFSKKDAEAFWALKSQILNMCARYPRNTTGSVDNTATTTSFTASNPTTKLDSRKPKGEEQTRPPFDDTATGEEGRQRTKDSGVTAPRDTIEDLPVENPTDSLASRLSGRNPVQNTNPPEFKGASLGANVMDSAAINQNYTPDSLSSSHVADVPGFEDLRRRTGIPGDTAADSHVMQSTAGNSASPGHSLYGMQLPDSQSTTVNNYASPIGSYSSNIGYVSRGREISNDSHQTTPEARNTDLAAKNNTPSEYSPHGVLFPETRSRKRRSDLKPDNEISGESKRKKLDSDSDYFKYRHVADPRASALAAGSASSGVLASASPASWGLHSTPFSVSPAVLGAPSFNASPSSKIKLNISEDEGLAAIDEYNQIRQLGTKPISPSSHTNVNVSDTNVHLANNEPIAKNPSNTNAPSTFGHPTGGFTKSYSPFTKVSNLGAVPPPELSDEDTPFEQEDDSEFAPTPNTSMTPFYGFQAPPIAANQRPMTTQPGFPSTGVHFQDQMMNPQFPPPANGEMTLQDHARLFNPYSRSHLPVDQGQAEQDDLFDVGDGVHATDTEGNGFGETWPSEN